MLDRRRFLITTGLTTAGLAATGLGAATIGSTAASATAKSATAISADTGTPQGWLRWIAEHRDTVGLLVDDGAGRTLAHRAHARQQLASSIKVVHLAAYATAVAEGTLDPREPIRLGDWDAHHPWVADGRAHQSAYTALGIPCDELGIATDPERRVPLDTLAAAMVDFSDNAATDYLRSRLGDEALEEAAAAAGWRAPDVRSLQGEVLMLIMPEQLPPKGTPTPVRTRRADRLATRFREDPAFREYVATRIPRMPATYPAQLPWADGHATGSAHDLFTAHRSLATGAFTPVAAVPLANRHLERAFASKVPPGAEAIAFKGGSLPGKLTAGMTLRRADRSGTIAVLFDGIAEADYANSGPFIDLLIGVLDDPAMFDGLADALRA